MIPRSRVRLLAGALVVLAVAGTRAAAQPNPILELNTYVLFAQDSMHVRGTTTIDDGNVGVNRGTLYLRGTVSAPDSDFAADMTRLDFGTDCEDLFTNTLVGAGGSCPKNGSAPVPIIANIATACGFPKPFPACNPSKPVVVEHDQTVVLAPGVYGDLTVEGGGAGPAEVRLAGDYVFCNVRASRDARILFTAPSTVSMPGTSHVSNATDVGPDNVGGIPVPGAPRPGEIHWFVQGSQARFSRKGRIALYACAPNAKMRMGSGTTLTGRFVARSIRLKKSTVTFTPPFPPVCGDTVISSPEEQCETNADCGGNVTCVSCQCSTTTTTTPTSTTTTTTLPPCTDDDDCNGLSPAGAFVCEDGHCVPACDDDADCNNGSPEGAFVCEDGHCVPRCDDDADCNSPLVCEDGHCVTTTTTTTTTNPGTTSSVTSTTISGPTTTTTLKECTTTDDCPIGVCRDGFCVPECDSDDDCNGASPEGAFVCRDGRCVPGGEICNDCVDNDGDGFIDFEDPDCCDPQAGQQFAMDLRKGRVRQRTSTQSLLRLKGGLARSGLGGLIDPRTQAMTIQIRSQEGGEILCANIPAGKFVKKRKVFKFSRKKSPVPVEVGRNLDRVVIKILRNGQVRYRLKGKRTELTTPAEGTLQITVGFTRPGTSASQNVCSQAVRLFRGGKRGQLRFP